jgi:uncharacterized phage protein (TIGR02218 family)
VKSVSSNLATHLAGEVLSLATCWKVTRQDGQVFGFTDHDRDLVISGVTYVSATGYSGSAVQSTADLSVDNLEVHGFLDSASITEDDLLAGVWDHAQIVIFRVNYQSVADGVVYMRKGWIGEVRSGRASFTAELRGLAQKLSQTIGEVYTPSCRADLFDARCGLDEGTFTVTGTVTHVTDRRTFRDTSRAEADGWFAAGKVTWTSGLNVDREMEIRSHAASSATFSLYLPMHDAIQVGDTYSMIPGCLKRSIADCKDKFNNIVNFRGEPYVPGMDAITRGAR